MGTVKRESLATTSVRNPIVQTAEVAILIAISTYYTTQHQNPADNNLINTHRESLTTNIACLVQCIVITGSE